MDNTIARLILEQLDIKSLRNLEKYCEKYLNYSVDYKQVIAKYNVKLKADDIADLQEYCNFLICMKQVEQKDTKAVNAIEGSENITSTMNEKNGVESKKKE